MHTLSHSMHWLCGILSTQHVLHVSEAGTLTHAWILWSPAKNRLILIFIVYYVIDHRSDFNFRYNLSRCKLWVVKCIQLVTDFCRHKMTLWHYCFTIVQTHHCEKQNCSLVVSHQRVYQSSIVIITQDVLTALWWWRTLGISSVSNCDR